jgi:2-dehydro-3-deoxygluconokinase
MDHHRISAELVKRDARRESRPYNVAGIVDRIGGGDAFAVGLLQALSNTQYEEISISQGFRM